MNRTPEQNKILHTLLNRLNLQDMKQDLVLSFSGGRTEHSSEMTENECQALIDYLHNKLGNIYRKENRQRKKIIALFTKMGYTTPEGKADMPRIYAWVEKYGYLHKPLNKYTYKELPKLVSQAEQYYHSFLKKI